ncbi:hypothetical protein LIPSTDRAFT_333783 [Lipomyces starkeyi NRRL Y-11557]|uniref:HTH psq-type domain-containing protein n=1 Tax=Lipomyces starkeyi NRRL Y-11557 TaxID=675824 RepID=A0A1E3PX58_LIPST|nr:hypothetical protein LIPSTDRAFT_333783 [Lipomyces starkeyi NRRL Y-11557]
MATKATKVKIILALLAVKQNPKLSICEVARIYSVSRATLARRQRGQRSRRDTLANSRRLTDLEEYIIVEYILDLDSRTFSPRISGVEDMATAHACWYKLVDLEIHYAASRA